MDFLSGRRVEDLFGNNSFLNAIRKKDKCEVKKTIRKTCGFHLNGMLNTSVCKWLKAKQPERFEQESQLRTKEFEQEIEWLAEIIIESGMGILPESEIDPELLISAIRQNQIDVVKFYFWVGGTPHLKTKVYHKKQRGGESLIHFAAELNENDIMMFMTENGADVNLKSYNMETPIHRATAAGNQDMVRLLWGCGADIDAQKHDGETALMIATKNSDLAVAYFLLRLGTNFKITNTDGHSALDLAKMHGSDGIIEMLTAREAGMESPKIEEYVYFKPTRPDEINSV